ncbi:P-loop containing nucleoside triphosphate hydrolase superfamily protein [Trifolium repens]|nr:P-loop containing nucleoside triphosphate hydrolase superfamily protein [Trifolium repens]
MGGGITGMRAGERTVLKDVLKEYINYSMNLKWEFLLIYETRGRPSSKAVIVEAHAFKEKDVIYRALNNKGNYDDMLQTAEYVHQSSTNAASSLLVAALNKG